MRVPKRVNGGKIVKGDMRIHRPSINLKSIGYVSRSRQSRTKGRRRNRGTHTSICLSYMEGNGV